MRVRAALLVGVVSLLAIGPLASAEPRGDKQSDRHVWRAIAYPSLPCPWATKVTTPELRLPGGDESGGLQFRLTFHRPGVGLREEGEKFLVFLQGEEVMHRTKFAAGLVFALDHLPGHLDARQRPELRPGPAFGDELELFPEAER